jgi:hypothetical protein
MKKEYKVQYSDDESEVCVIPSPSISTSDLKLLVKHFSKNGYKWWKPADERRGFTFSKVPGK